MVKEASNVIIRNLGVKKVLADNGDALAVRKSRPPPRGQKRRHTNEVL